MIQQQIENPLAGRILKGEIRDGDHVVIASEGKTFTFKIAGGASPQRQ